MVQHGAINPPRLIKNPSRELKKKFSHKMEIYTKSENNRNRRKNPT